MIDAALAQAQSPGRAWRARGAGSRRRGRRWASSPGWAARQSASTTRVLQRQHAALREVGQHRVGGIAHQRDAAGRPGGQRRQAVERPLAPVAAPRRGLGEARRGSRPSCASRSRFVRLRVPVAPCQSSAAMTTTAISAPPPHGVVHDMHAGRQPQADQPACASCAAPGGGNDGARRRRADELRAASSGRRHARTLRPQAVGADERARPSPSRPPRSWPARHLRSARAEASAKPVRSSMRGSAAAAASSAACRSPRCATQ